MPTLQKTACLILFLVTTQAQASTPFFWDDFDRTDLFDSTISWFDDLTPEEDLNIVDGNMVLVPLEDSFPSLTAGLDEEIDEFRLETTFRFQDAVNGLNPFFMFTFRDDTSSNVDWAGISSSGRMIPGTSIGGNTAWTRERNLGSYADMVANDIHMVVEVRNDEQTITTWLDGDERDEDFVLTEARATSGTTNFSLTLNPDSALQESILIRHFAFLPLVDGDFNATGVLDVGDIDLMRDQLRSPDVARVRVFDLNADGITDELDDSFLIAELFKTQPGDANLDQQVSFDDFLALSAGFGQPGGWAQGDFDGSGEVQFPDFLLLSTNFGAKADVATVPEPTGVPIILLQLLVSLGILRHRLR